MLAYSCFVPPALQPGRTATLTNSTGVMVHFFWGDAAGGVTEVQPGQTRSLCSNRVGVGTLLQVCPGEQSRDSPMSSHALQSGLGRDLSRLTGNRGSFSPAGFGSCKLSAADVGEIGRTLSRADGGSAQSFVFLIQLVDGATAVRVSGASRVENKTGKTFEVRNTPRSATSRAVPPRRPAKNVADSWGIVGVLAGCGTVRAVGGRSRAARCALLAGEALKR